MEIWAKTSRLGWKGAEFREYRLAIPPNMEKGGISHEVANGVDEVGKTEAVGSEDPAYGRHEKDTPRMVQD